MERAASSTTDEHTTTRTRADLCDDPNEAYRYHSVLPIEKVDIRMVRLLSGATVLPYSHSGSHRGQSAVCSRPSSRHLG
jgi:hypothetical protein